MNNRVYQSNGVTIINIGDWDIGVYIHDNGELSVYIDNNTGKVLPFHEVADDDRQWAQRFAPERKDPHGGLLRRRMTWQ